KSRSRPRSRTPNENWLHLTGAEQIAKVAILTFLGRKKCSFLTQEKRPFLGYSSSSSRILTVTQTEQNNCQEDRLFHRRRSPINRGRARRRGRGRFPNFGIWAKTDTK